jgi:hypothetical protein
MAVLVAGKTIVPCAGIVTHACRRCSTTKLCCFPSSWRILEPRSREAQAQFLPTLRRDVVGRRKRSDVLPCPGPPAGARYERRHQSSTSAKALLNVARHGTYPRVGAWVVRRGSARSWDVRDLATATTLPPPDCRLPPRDCRLPTADCHLATADCRPPNPTADYQIKTATLRLPPHDYRLPPRDTKPPCMQHLVWYGRFWVCRLCRPRVGAWQP